MTNLTDIQRERIIRDLVNHSLENSYHAKPEKSNEELREEETHLRALGDASLKNYWETHVGDWLCSIGNEYPSFIEAWEDAEATGRYDNPADWQWDKLMTTGEIDYGYQLYMYEPPYTDVEPRAIEDFDIVNYADIRDSLELILDIEVPDKKEAIIDSLDDALANHAHDLVLGEDITFNR